MRLFVALDLPWTLRQRLASLAGLGIPGRNGCRRRTTI